MNGVLEGAKTVVDAALIERYDRTGPRYTSYPTAMEFVAEHGPNEHAEIAAASDTTARPLSLYVHIPFCATVCFYCACNKIVTRNRARSGPYLQRLHREIELQSALVDRRRPLRQLHWGGGTPTFLSHDQMSALMEVTADHFSPISDARAEYSIEVDPREADDATVRHLRELGFNRISLGVQDLDERVQRAVNRVQPEAVTRAVLDAARGCGFRSVSMDLIYGLPYQSVVSIERTLERVIEMDPDRLSFFNYAHLPHRFKTQRQIDASALPSANDKLQMLATAIDRLEAAGYVHIGMDHFAKPNDALALAQRDGSLHRNFQGYSTHGDCDLIGVGVSAISSFDAGYSQNTPSIELYAQRLDEAKLAIVRGVRLSRDDRIRRAVIRELICHYRLDLAALSARFDIDAADYFEAELARLATLQADGLVDIDERGVYVAPRGRLLVRHVCMVFDRYRNSTGTPGFSRLI